MDLQSYIYSNNIDIICLNETKIDLKTFKKEEENIKSAL